MKYYLHDTSSFDDEKITALFLKFGYEGLGLFYTLLEKIGKQEKPVKTEVLKAQLKVGKHLQKVWEFMEEIEIISSNNGETFNEQLLYFGEKYQIKKEKTREKVQQWRERQRDIKSVTGYVPVSNLPKVKESKVKESKDIIKKDAKASSKSDFLLRIITCFQEEYLRERETEYHLPAIGKERAAAGKILAEFKKKFPDNNSDQIITHMRGYFAMCVAINDQWLYNNMSLPIIVSKFNEIKSILKNGTHKRNNGATDRELAESVYKNFGRPGSEQQPDNVQR